MSAGASAAPGSGHPGLLAEIMTNTLDLDYQAAADRASRRHAPPRRAGGPVLIAVVLVFGAMLGVSALRTAQDRPAAAAERSELVAQIHQRQNRLDELHTELSDLDAAIASLQTTTGTAKAELAGVDAEATSLGAAAGTRAVSGPGIRIVADNAPDAGSLSSEGTILDTDLQALVNGLWKAGAEAIGINGHRLTAVTAIRTAGQAITVDYRSLAPPYVIEAIGNPQTLPARLLETAGGQAWQSLARNFGITFETTSLTEVELPADSSVRVDHAQPVGGR